MRFRLRLHSIAQLALVAAVLFFAAPSCVRAQAAPALPKSWDDAVNQLAGKVASALSPSAPIELSFENTSSLDAASAAAINSSMRAALASHSFHLVAPGAISAKTPARVIFTLSESTASYVWIVRVVGEDTNADSIPPAMVAVAKLDNLGSTSTNGYISLEKRLVWKQPGEFLDFALLPHPAAGSSALIVLDTNHLAVYEMTGSVWQVSHTSPIPQTALVSRDRWGQIDLAKSTFHMAGRDCTGDPDLSGTIHCRETRTPESLLLRGKTGSLPDAAGDGVGTAISDTCNAQSIFLGTGDGDWTQADAIQAYMGDASSTSSPSGSPLSFPGPVLSLHSDSSDANSARALVHNLKTGDYEAYIVTATCSH
jgi:hypothetical protein